MNKVSILSIIVAMALAGCNSGSGDNGSSHQKSSGQTYKIADTAFDAAKLEELTYSVNLLASTAQTNAHNSGQNRTFTQKFSSYSNSELASLIQKSIDEEENQEDKAELESLQKVFNKLDNDGKSSFFNINETHYDLNGTQIGEDEDSLYFTSNFSTPNTEFVFELDADSSISTDKNIENIHQDAEFIVNGNDLLNSQIKVSSTVTKTARLIDFTELTSRLWQGAGPDLGGSADTCTLIYTTDWNSNDKIIESLKVGSDTIETFKIVSGDTYNFSCQSYRGETKTANQTVRKTIWYNPVFGNVKVNEMIGDHKNEDTVLTSFKLK
ncbi:hypothetical protein MHO82_15865 [Vibrio sp. Of7-15]|uniref:hypothetical protein n=1 Tax=Vibrio sp. Of7-15 TaxID=2724879 RepID=UPI001EF24472|nr:hypothetical protein [Vibrio sp. Of7-15]MCG7498345.1 hypothetical protein [Vibrio sp. Of7-15]